MRCNSWVRCLDLSAFGRVRLWTCSAFLAQIVVFGFSAQALCFVQRLVGWLGVPTSCLAGWLAEWLLKAGLVAGWLVGSVEAFGVQCSLTGVRVWLLLWDVLMVCACCFFAHLA